jgi:RimJ/RimL family protein N-acetyltransferase
MHFENIRFETERLVIRPVVSTDAPAFFGMHSDSVAMEYWSCPPYTQSSQAEELVSRAIEGRTSGAFLMLALQVKDRAEVIGSMNLFSLHEASRRAEVGYFLARSHWRRGFMSEAFESFITFCFDDLNLNRLEADIDPNNVASSALLTKNGFQREGFLRQRWIVGGKKTDSELYGLLSEER